MSDIREICNLSEEELAARRDELRRELVPHVRSRAALADGVALDFESTPERRRALEEFVAFERGCCPGLEFALREEGGALRLEIQGLDPRASVFLDGTSASPTAEPVAAPGGGAGAARAGTVGALGAFALLCGLPLAATAVVGAELAAPLGVLEHPAVLATGILAAAGGAWGWERRRARRAGGGCGC